MDPRKLDRWARAQEHEREYWVERGDAPAVIDRRIERYRPAFARVAAMLPGDPVVVDVGSGPTCWGRFLPGRRAFVDPLMHSYVDRWKGDLPDGLLINAPGEAIPLSTGSCDLALSVNALDHCADPGLVVAECVRVLRPGGILAMSVYIHPRVRAVARRIREGLGFASDAHPYSLTHSQMHRLYESNGVEVVEVLDLGSPSFRTKSRLWRRAEPLFIGRTSVA